MSSVSRVRVWQFQPGPGWYLGGFSAGAAKPIKRTVTSQNNQVLAALNTLHPGVTFGFNEPAWRSWYEEKHEPPKVSLRRVE